MMSYGGVRFGMGDLNSEAEAAGNFLAHEAGGGLLAKVTTKDQPPSGDLIIRTAPNTSAPQIAGGGAEKDGIVAVVNANASPDGVFAEVIWPGGPRRPAWQGFAKKAFLAFLPPGQPNAPPLPPGVTPPGVTPPPGGSSSEEGLSTGAKIGLGVGALAALGLVAYLATR